MAGTWNHVEMEQLLAACTRQPSIESHQRWFAMSSGLCILETMIPAPCPLQHPLSLPHLPPPSQSLYKLSGGLLRTSASVRTYPWWNTNYILARLHGILGFPGGAEVKNLPANAEDAGDTGSTPGLGGSPAEGNGNPLQYSCLENPMDRGAWWATVHGIANSWTLNTGTHAHVGY